MEDRKFRVKDLLLLNSLEGIERLAGNSAMGNIISNMNVMEVPDVADWVQKDEFLMTTGYQYRDDVTQFLALIPRLKEQNVAALGIKPGRYIDEIPQNVIDCCNEYGLPLLKLPIQTSFSLVIREAMEKILLYDIRHEENFVYQLIHPKQVTKKELTEAASSFGISVTNTTVFHFILPIFRAADPQYQNAALRKLIKDALEDDSCHVLTMVYHGLITILCVSDNEDTWKNTYLAASETLSKIAKDGGLQLCVSSSGSSITHLDIVYQDTDRLRSIAASLENSNSIVTWEALGLYAILPYISNTPFHEYCLKKYIVPLLQYDNSHNSHLYETLEEYINCDCNMKLSANNLFVHYNTMNYRISIIKDILNLDLTNSNVITEINLALKIERFVRNSYDLSVRKLLP